MARYKYHYSQEIWHHGLNKYRVVKGNSTYEVKAKMAAIQAQWDEQWARKCEIEDKRKEKEDRKRDVKNAIEKANKMTMEAETNIYKIDNILSIKNKKVLPIDLYNLDAFSQEKPRGPKIEAKKREPLRSDAIYNSGMPFLAIFSKNKKRMFVLQMDEKYNRDHDKWEKEEENRKVKNLEHKLLYDLKLIEWQKAKEIFDEQKEFYNTNVDKMFAEYDSGNKVASEQYYLENLYRLKLPIEYDYDYECEYIEQTKMLILDAVLPEISNFPKLKKVTYVKSTGEFKETYHTESFIKKIYDKAIYDIVLLLVKTIFESSNKHLEFIVLNGKINTIDRATGKQISPYILSIKISKEDFSNINVELVDSKEWFRSCRGVSAAYLSKTTPIAPIVNMNKNDSRFIEGYDIIGNLDFSVNLAAMDWKDFENLIREVFEEEFNINGGEVKITQASRDGGVDAIAFDPDPIRGGKIVIQAKRYTNVVGVSAVRDLYGTVMNEGAIKGILVTTSNYGNDAYEFAKDKPLTLMNGSNLLYLLEKHGHKASIDLKEAKKMLNNL